MMMQFQHALKPGQPVPDINNNSTSLYFLFLIFEIRRGSQPECVFVQFQLEPIHDDAASEGFNTGTIHS